MSQEPEGEYCRDLDKTRLALYFDWPSQQAGFRHTARHLTEFAVLRKKDRKMVPIWEVMPSAREEYVVVGRLLPRPGFDGDQAPIFVEINTNGYSVDFGEEDLCWAYPDGLRKSFTRGIWLKDKMKGKTDIYYQLHEPASSRYSPHFKKISKDLKLLFQFHDALAYTDYQDLEEPYREGGCEVHGEGKYSVKVFHRGEVYWKIRKNVTVDVLLDQEPQLDSAWLKEKENSYFVWENCNLRFNFSSRLSEFSEDLHRLKNGDGGVLGRDNTWNGKRYLGVKGDEVVVPNRPGKKGAKDFLSGKSKTHPAGGDELTIFQKTFPAAIFGKKDGTMAPTPHPPNSLETTTESSRNVIQKRKRWDDDDVVEEEISGKGGVKTKTSDTKTQVGPVKKTPRPKKMDVLGKFTSTSREIPGILPSQTHAAGKTRPSQASPLKAPNPKLEPTPSEDKQAQEQQLLRDLSNPIRLQKLKAIEEMQKNEERELKRRAQEMRSRQSLQDKWDSTQKPRPPKEDATLASLKWAEGCNKICSCRERGLHPILCHSDTQLFSDSPHLEHNEPHVCCHYSGYHKILGDKKPGITRIKFADMTQARFFLRDSAPTEFVNL